MYSKKGELKGIRDVPAQLFSDPHTLPIANGNALSNPYME